MKRNMALVAGLLCSFAGGATACLWDSDTLANELEQGGASVIDLILHQYPSHGGAYHENRAATARRALAAGPDEAHSRDLAAALLRLDDAPGALAELEEIERANPSAYETLASKGVVLARMGRLQESLEYLKKALQQRPEGHPGSGDYFARMVDYELRRRASPKHPPEADFLGRGYETLQPDPRPDAAFLPVMPDLDKVKAFIQEEPCFPDAYVVMGDVLAGHVVRFYESGGRMDLNLALWSYVRALQLGHPHPSAIRARIGEVFNHWRASLSHKFSSLYVEDVDGAIDGITRQLELAASWQPAFHRIEAELLKSQGSAPFEEIERVMITRGLHRVEPHPRGLRQWIETRSGGSDLLSRVVVGLGAMLVIAGMIRRRRAARGKDPVG